MGFFDKKPKKQSAQDTNSLLDTELASRRKSDEVVGLIPDGSVQTGQPAAMNNTVEQTSDTDGQITINLEAVDETAGSDSIADYSVSPVILDDEQDMYSTNREDERQEVAASNTDNLPPTLQFNKSIIKVLQTVSGTSVDKAVDNRSLSVLEDVVAFVGVTGGVGASTLVVNTAKALYNKGLKVLIIDTDLYSPSIYRQLGLNVNEVKHDLISLLIGTSKLNESILFADGANRRFGVLTSVGAMLHSTFQADNLEAMKSLIDMSKDLFDIVLLDCGNHPAFECSVAALSEASKVFSVWGEAPHTIVAMETMKINMAQVGILPGKFNSVIFNKRTNAPYKESIFTESGLTVVALLPFIEQIISLSLLGKTYIESGTNSKYSKYFEKGMSNILSHIISEKKK